MLKPVRTQAADAPAEPPRGSPLEVFLVALRLGLTSFGGPIAHLGYFQNEYVKRRQWVDQETYADLVALSQSLPGAASSKLGISIGIIRAGLPGGLLAWLGFTLPSALVLAFFGLGAGSLGPGAQGWLDGLQIVAVAVVALAVWNMAGQLAPDLPRGAIVIIVAVLELSVPTRFTTVTIIACAGLAGYFLLRSDEAPRPLPRKLVTYGRRAAVAAAVTFFALLIGLPLLRQATDSQAVALFDSFYRAGALVFGGGTVVLPLLQDEVARPGWVSAGDFLAGYGAAQAVPGPLFTFSSYLGAAARPEPNGMLGAVIALVGIFLPSFLLVIATMPTFGAMRARPRVQAVFRGVNAAVVGVLLAALYDPLWTGTINEASDFSLALVAFGLLAIAKLPAWLVVALTATGGFLVATLGG